MSGDTLDNQHSMHTMMQLLLKLESEISKMRSEMNDMRVALDNRTEQLNQFQTETAKLINTQFLKLKSQSLNDKFCADEPFVGPDGVKKRQSSGRLTKSSSWEIKKKGDLKPISETL